MSFLEKILKLIKKHSKISQFLSLCTLFFLSHLIYSYVLPLPAREWINSNLKKIQSGEYNKFSFALFGGNNADNMVFEDLLKQIDHDPDILFAFDLGDAVMKGRKPYYQYFIKQVNSNLGIPLLTLIGENEVTGEGRDLYQKILGPFYYSFKIGRDFFIVIDNAEEKDLDKQQIEWLENELKKVNDPENCIIFMHRPFYMPGESKNSHFMSDQISLKLFNLFLNYHVSHIFASGINGFYDGEFKGIPYTVTGGAGGVPDNSGSVSYFNFLKVRVEKNIIHIEMKKVYMPGHTQVNSLKYRVMAYADNMIGVHRTELTLMVIIFLSFAVWNIYTRKKKSGAN